MKARSAFCILGLLAGLGPGCRLARDGGPTTPNCGSEFACSRGQPGPQAWAEVHKAAAAGVVSGDYASGFRDGFNDSASQGPNAQPPALPPVRYRSLLSQTPEGAQAVAEWYAGYRQGLAAARGQTAPAASPAARSLPRGGDLNPPVADPGSSAVAVSASEDLATRWNWLRPSEQPSEQGPQIPDPLPQPGGTAQADPAGPTLADRPAPDFRIRTDRLNSAAPPP
jgi:hypothetical protein